MTPRRRLRRLGSAARWYPTSLEDRSSLLPNPAARPATQARQRGPVLVVTVVVGALVVAASAAALTVAAPQPAASPTPTTTRAADGVVPWIADSPAPTPTPIPVSARDCTAADLTFGTIPKGTVMNQIQAYVPITQRSSVPCAIRGAIGVASTRDGAREMLRRLPIAQLVAAVGLRPSTDGGGVLPPGQVVGLRIHGVPPVSGISAYDRPVWLVINGQYLLLRGELPGNVVDRGLSLEVDSAEDPQDSGTGPYSALLARITLPEKVVAGTTMRYTVRLENQRATAFTFGADCPSYEQLVNVDGRAKTDEDHVLACTGVVIPPNGSVTFAMQVPIPAGATGTMRTGWFLTNGPSDAAQAAHPVTLH